MTSGLRSAASAQARVSGALPTPGRACGGKGLGQLLSWMGVWARAGPGWDLPGEQMLGVSRGHLGVGAGGPREKSASGGRFPEHQAACRVLFASAQLLSPATPHFPSFLRFFDIVQKKITLQRGEHRHTCADGGADSRVRTPWVRRRRRQPILRGPVARLPPPGVS